MMIEEVQGRQPKRRRIRLLLVIPVILVLALILPPLVSISRYRGRITELISTSLGRPVQLSSVGFRLLPWPGLVLNDLSVAEDPVYGAEPVLHANTVTASIRLLPLWRGRLEIGSISVDEASLNVVRSAPGRWNLDPLFRTAAAKAGRAGGESQLTLRLPYLEATNSRINFKSGPEKLPFSLVNTDFSFWQEEPGVWRIRLRGQPARTDVSLDLADTGEVSMEASLRSAPELRLMPLHLDAEWQEAQLGQLAKLLTGSDIGWRGNLTADLHLDGTADAAHVSARLRATAVHRIEFAPAESAATAALAVLGVTEGGNGFGFAPAGPLDFDANCAFVYHYSRRALDNLQCDSPLGDGHIQLSGDLPGEGAPPSFSVDFQNIPVAAGLDLLRTMRSGLEPGLETSGTVGGRIVYAESHAQPKPVKSTRSRLSKATAARQSTLTGSLVVRNFELQGGSLSQPIQAAKILFKPATIPHSQFPALIGSMAIHAGGTEPLLVGLRLSFYGYHATAKGQIALARVKELASLAAGPEAAALHSLAGGPASVDLTAEGPWLPAQEILFRNTPLTATAQKLARQPSKLVAEANPIADVLSGTVTLRNANWNASYLANRVVIPEATLHLAYGEILWDPVQFSYGPLKGRASLILPADCKGSGPCPVRFHAYLGKLKVGTLQDALLGAHERGALLATLIERLHLSSPPAWPPLEGTVQASSLLLGPVTLEKPVAVLRILPSGAKITSLTAGVLGGHVHASGTLTKPGGGSGQPDYALQASFFKLRAPAVGKLFGMRWGGGDFNAGGRIDLSGFTASDLAASAKGTLQFEWQRGIMSHQFSGSTATGAAVAIPAALDRFDRWTGEATIAHGVITLRHSQVLAAGGKHTIEATLTLSDPVRVTFPAPTAKPR